MNQWTVAVPWQAWKLSCCLLPRRQPKITACDLPTAATPMSAAAGIWKFAPGAVSTRVAL